MSSEWLRGTLGEYIELSNGKTRPEEGGRTSVYGSNGIIGSCKKSNSPKETIVIGRVGTYCGSLHFSKEECWVTDNAIKAVAKKGGHSRYFFDLLKTCDLGRLRAGSGQPLLNQSILGSIEIEIPPIEEQRAIAHILGTLDDKIELNRKTNETLEAMSKALFKSWFVDFDPVRAKAEGRPTGLPAEISDLFPDSFEDSELGEIPSGWGVQSAGSQYQVSIGKTPPRKESQWFSTSTADMPWLSIRDLGEIGVYADRTSEYLTREAVEKFNVRVVPADTVVLSFKLTIGRVAITGSEMLTNEAIAHFLTLKKRVDPEYTYCLLSQYDYHSLGSTSSIATAVNSQILRDMPLVVPPEAIARSFCDATMSIFSSIKCSQRETHCLSDFRDALLPKLISGEIRIPDAEKMLEEVGV